ncbi:hypothetical protein T4A_7382 [Trichinella pseudospiralis]|uniref:Uncharacterized protein n=1 Tax=Trichinella pseudospiralis TaxID=6337 RepID=A0A0V1EAX3_TRIPS|nr:hypothetical protein T4A_3462 [Trichinella pseudospiralis]KRY70854.1 hypothetical protein T4A_7382 [Trichinella pseudospiralis]
MTVSICHSKFYSVALAVTKPLSVFPTCLYI